ncbi:hypothetical protein MKY09_05370 [Psychrobacillus sp. FSL K6-4046]|uniref:hypothetical protein n=1 Tax=Psychrobacillus sp. FSL K6-4046 TaxID=2921550 RepID=UPI00315A5F4B
MQTMADGVILDIFIKLQIGKMILFVLGSLLSRLYFLFLYWIQMFTDHLGKTMELNNIKLVSYPFFLFFKKKPITMDLIVTGSNKFFRF